MDRTELAERAVEELKLEEKEAADCHICGELTQYTCDICAKPVCVEHMVLPYVPRCEECWPQSFY